LFHVGRGRGCLENVKARLFRPKSNGDERQKGCDTLLPEPMKSAAVREPSHGGNDKSTLKQEANV
jgi:hypothetical protein